MSFFLSIDIDSWSLFRIIQFDFIQNDLILDYLEILEMNIFKNGNLNCCICVPQTNKPRVNQPIPGVVWEVFENKQF